MTHKGKATVVKGAFKIAQGQQRRSISESNIPVRSNCEAL
jgi:hypothetical protein